MARRVHPFQRQRIAALCLAAVLLPAAAACGPTAEQFEARQATQDASASASAPAVPGRVHVRTAEPEPKSAPSSPPLQVGVSGAQAGMAADVQAACQWLLRGDTAPFPDAGSCVSAAMVAGGGARQKLTTTASWLPPGTYSMEFQTAPAFSMELGSQDGNLEISVDGTSRTLRTKDAAVEADADGGAEEAYAAVLVDAAELTANPDRLRNLLDTARPALPEYGAEHNGVPVTKLTAVIEASEPGGFAGSLVLLLDDLYRPLFIEYTGTTRGIHSSVRASVTGWEDG
ncbi:hypothetical protein H9639_02190 [Arthrobacter sp. Sa2CUA1]|uniref:Lipoprotein n=1 Tax=Arthrobacter gallicola TaxID=2762225 RepID=A0ABR8UNH8_9MICC|nr:hypothetical protein [Arthrobacter gallicola]MBD7994109.1 hypothetical protein [Arthrobacter gallicola]